MSCETHYAQPLTHRQKASGMRRRYVSFNADGNISIFKECIKSDRHKKLRQEDKISCLEGMEDYIFIPIPEVRRNHSRIMAERPKKVKFPKVKNTKRKALPRFYGEEEVEWNSLDSRKSYFPPTMFWTHKEMSPSVSEHASAGCRGKIADFIAIFSCILSGLMLLGTLYFFLKNLVFRYWV